MHGVAAGVCIHSLSRSVQVNCILVLVYHVGVWLGSGWAQPPTPSLPSPLPLSGKFFHMSISGQIQQNPTFWYLWRCLASSCACYPPPNQPYQFKKGAITHKIKNILFIPALRGVKDIKTWMAHHFSHPSQGEKPLSFLHEGHESKSEYTNISKACTALSLSGELWYKERD